MQIKDAEKIKGLVYAADNMKEASMLLWRGLAPMGKAGFSRDEMKQFYDKLDPIRAELFRLHDDLMSQIYKCPDS